MIRLSFPKLEFCLILLENIFDSWERERQTERQTDRQTDRVIYWTEELFFFTCNKQKNIQNQDSLPLRQTIVAIWAAMSYIINVDDKTNCSMLYNTNIFKMCPEIENLLDIQNNKYIEE